MKSDVCLHCEKEFKKNYSIQKFCSLLCSNRHNLNGLNVVHLPRKNKNLAEFIGITLGDGNVSKYFVSITLNSVADREYIKYVTDLAKKLFLGAPLSILPSKRACSTRIQISSRIVADFLKNMGMISHKKKIPGWILRKKTYELACLKGQIDTEGSISYKTYKTRKGISLYKQLNFRNTDSKLMIFVRNLLIKINLKPTTTLKRSLYLSNHPAIDVYRRKVGFGNNKLLKRSLVDNYSSYQKWRGTEAAITGWS